MWESIKNFFKNLFSSSPSAPAVESPAPVAVPAAIPAPVIKPLAPLTISKSLKRGDKGPDVAIAQGRAKEMGYKITVDSDYGAETANVIRTLQKDKGLMIDGELGPTTAKAMGLVIMSQPQAPKPIPVSSPVIVPSTGSTNLIAEHIKEAKLYTYVNEKAGKNRSPDIDRWNKALGVALASPWCMSYAQNMIFAIEKRYKINSRVYQSAHCLTVWNKTPADLKHKTPQVGDLIVYNYAGTTNGHVGLVIAILPNGYVLTIEGNTGPSATEVERNGDGVYIKSRAVAGAGSMKVLGFIRVWDQQSV